MYKNFFKIAIRNLIKNKSQSIINIIGLSIGIATCLIIMLFVVDELSYDRYNDKADQIMRVVFRGKMNGELMKEAVVPAPVANTLLQEFPEVLEATRIRNLGTPHVTIENTTYRDSRFAFVDSNFLEVFDLSLIKGNPVSLLKEPNTIIITTSIAEKYFGKEEPIGKVMDIEEIGQQFKVTGVIENVPENSHFHFDLFASMESLADSKEPRWLSSNYFSYIVLEKGYDYRNLEAKFPSIIKKYMGPQFQEALGMSFEEFEGKGNSVGLFLQPLTEIHLYSDFSSASQLEQGGDIKTIYIFSAIALFMLLIASINFMNLTTAEASKRLKEVGIRKVLGSRKDQLIRLFLTESFVVTIIAMAVAFLLLIQAIPVFNYISGKALEVNYLSDPYILATLSVFGIIISLISGSYPAFYLSSFKPVTALKNKYSGANNKKGIRSGLVIFQFVISVGLIIATIVVDQQMSYIQNKKIGYDKEQLVVLRETGYLKNQENSFKDKLLSDPRISNITMSGFIPAGPTNNSMSGVYPDHQSEAIRRTALYYIDDQYIPTMGMELATGRNFSKDYGAEANNVIINETAALAFGFGDNPLGRRLTRNIDDRGNKEEVVVIGVIKDFHFRSLHEPIEPLMMLQRASSGLVIKTNTSNIQTLLSDMKGIWASFEVEEPFTYSLLDDLYNQTYLDEQKTGTVLRIFTLLTILVACMGLFGLVTFTAAQRIKEIGIRKVLGSSVTQIVCLLSVDFLKLVFFSFLIAFPLGYWLMNRWLQEFAYRIEIQWSVFALAGAAAIGIACITLSFQSIKAALSNPIDSLRSE